jgi:hypothetical protein
VVRFGVFLIRRKPFEQRAAASSDGLSIFLALDPDGVLVRFKPRTAAVAVDWRKLSAKEQDLLFVAPSLYMLIAEAAPRARPSASSKKNRRKMAILRRSTCRRSGATAPGGNETGAKLAPVQCSEQDGRWLRPPCPNPIARAPATSSHRAWHSQCLTASTLRATASRRHVV